MLKYFESGSLISCAIESLCRFENALKVQMVYKSTLDFYFF